MENRDKFLDTMDRIEEIIGGIMFFVMIAFLTFNVFSWWLAGRRYGQLEEAITAALVWVSYLNLGSHYRKKQHVRVDFLLTKLSPKGQVIADIANDVCSFIIGVFILRYGWKLMLKSTNKLTGVLRIPYFWIDLGLVIGFISLLFNIIYRYVVTYPRMKKQKKEEAV